MRTNKQPRNLEAEALVILREQKWSGIWVSEPARALGIGKDKASHILERMGARGLVDSKTVGTVKKSTDTRLLT